MNITINNPRDLPRGFNPFLLGDQLCKKDIDMDAIFDKPLVPLKGDYIFDAGEWVLKLNRTDNKFTARNSHFYRIIDAKKFRDYILENNLTNELMVPEKYLYWHKSEEKFYVVSEKIDLSEEVATPANLEVEKNFKLAGASLDGQKKALAEGKPQRSLTAIQAKTLAELACLGYKDLDYNNLYFTLDGRVAIIDTKSQRDELDHGLALLWYWRNLITHSTAQDGILVSLAITLVGGISLLSLTPDDVYPLAGIAKLKLYCDDKDALKEIEIVEKKSLRSIVTKTIVKIALSCLMIFAASYVSLLPIRDTTARALKVTMRILFSINLFVLTLSLYETWNLNHQGKVIKV